MTDSARRFFRRTEQGGAAVEMAIVLPLLVLILAVPLFFARVFWYYSVAQKAAHDAARFLSTATAVEMRTVGAGSSEAPVAALARAIAATETEVLTPVMDPLFINVQCDFGTCGFAVPQTVRVLIQMRMRDGIFDAFTSTYYGDDGLPLVADVTMRYAGN